MAQYVYTMQGVTKIVPPKRAILENINLSFFPGAKIGVLGLNGAGKSSLLRIMAGVDTEIEGEARAQKDIKVGYLAQEPQLVDESTVRANVEQGVGEIMALLTEYNQISDKFAEPMDDDEMARLLERQGDLSSEIDAVDGWDIDRALDIAADALRLPDWDTPVSVLSGGERRRVALCKLLLAKPDMLLLDEPTNHLDAESVAWLERFLDEYPGTVVAVTHDRYFLDNVAGWILELDRGRGIPYEGNYSTWLEAKEARLAQEAAQEKARQRSIKSELEWVRSNPKARQSKSRARLQRFDELVNQEQQVRQETSELFIPTGERLGEKVIELSSVHKGFGDQLLIENLSVNIPRGAIVGIIGGNGSGKSTMLKVLAGILRADEGTAVANGRLSALLELGAGFHPELTGRENIYLNGAILGFTTRDIRKRFDDIVSFAELDQFIDEPVRNYSSGMYVRLGFSVAIHVEPEILLVDEVLAVGDHTFQRRCLERFDRLRDEGRTIVVVSHDLDMIGWLCERTAWINRGSLAALGPSGEVIEAFVTGSEGALDSGPAGAGLLSLSGLGPDDLVRSVDLLDPNGQPLPSATSCGPVTFRVCYDAARVGEAAIVALGLYRADGTHVTSINSGASSAAAGTDGVVEVDYHLPALPVQPGTYELSIALHDTTMKKVFERHTHLVRFSVEPGGGDHQTGLVALGGTWHARAGGA